MLGPCSKVRHMNGGGELRRKEGKERKAGKFLGGKKQEEGGGQENLTHESG